MKALIWGAGGRPEEVVLPRPHPGEESVLVEVRAAALTVIKPGTVMGTQGTGTIAHDPQGLLPEGTLVAWAGVAGSCAAAVCVPRDRIVAVPQGIIPGVAAAMLQPAMMAHVLLHCPTPVTAGSTVLINPADDPVGLISAQWAGALGARVIAVSPSGESAPHLDRATVVRRAHAATRRAAAAGGVDVALHGAGKQGLEHALASLRRRGTLCLYGQPPHPLKRISPVELASRGSLTLSCPVLEDYLREPDGFRTRAQAVTQALTEGSITIPFGRQYCLEEISGLRGEDLTGLAVLRF
ncbi:zinc-binding dehydrogenase [Corynebacterium sp. zg-331]|uniref:zinc-binding dehydrogenase n=1 Tax=unclassified Corynebacterium TaxID=2624378 RepID=UPI00128CDC85|nr:MULTISPECIES: zinc-binding dehydrogenase [unclassified Corynebacterium]MBC3185513.1 zinc-binding dehydrogenase [Corynebacterium sp. zg-331]MPV52007.1 hypothetical protein [Corynebacterium sp. zg331]